MSIETLPYPDPHTPVEGYTAISAGDVIRFSPLDRYGGPSDIEDCIVRDIECEPRDFTTGEAFPHPCHRMQSSGYLRRRCPRGWRGYLDDACGGRHPCRRGNPRL